MSGLRFLLLWLAPRLSSPGTLLCLVAVVVLLVVGVSICSAPAVVCISSGVFFFCFFVLRAVALGWACFSTFPVLLFFLVVSTTSVGVASAAVAIALVAASPVSLAPSLAPPLGVAVAWRVTLTVALCNWMCEACSAASLQTSHGPGPKPARRFAPVAGGGE